MRFAMHNMQIGKKFALLTTLALVAGVTTSFAQAPTKLSRVLPLVRPDGLTVGENPGTTLPKGIVKLEINGNTQTFRVNASKLATSYADGLAVHIGNSPLMEESSLFYVGVMSHSTNGQWRLEYTAKDGAAPPQLGVQSLTELVGFTIFLSSGGNAILRATVLDLVQNPAKLSYQKRVPLDLPDIPISSAAKGYIRVKYNGRTGASLIETKAKKLHRGNAYVAYVTSDPNVEIPEEDCERSKLVDTGKAVWGHDTGKGDELPGGTEQGLITAMDLSGFSVLVNDCYTGNHLLGIIPAPPYATEK